MSCKFDSRPSHGSASHSDGSHFLGFRIVFATCLTGSVRLILINFPRSRMSNINFLISFHSSCMLSLPACPGVPGGVSSSSLPSSASATNSFAFFSLLFYRHQVQIISTDPIFSWRSEANSSKIRNNTHTCQRHPDGNQNILGHLQCPE
jgi:hypothetical protein